MEVFTRGSDARWRGIAVRARVLDGTDGFGLEGWTGGIEAMQTLGLQSDQLSRLFRLVLIGSN